MPIETMAMEMASKLGCLRARDLLNLGASRDPDGAWTFSDGSRGRLLSKPVSVYSDDQMTRKVGLSYFDVI